MPKLFEITDAYTPEETIDGLPVEPVLPTERPRVIINTAEFDKPKPDPLWDDVEGFKTTVKNTASGIADAIKYASELDQKFTSSVLNFPKKAYENSDDLVKGIKNLFGIGEGERYQLWPEKVVKEALTSAGDIAKPNPYPEGSEQWYEYEGKRQEGMVPAAMAISALAGSGGLAGTGAKAGEVALGATPFLRPALRHKDRLYKGKPGQEHQDIIPNSLYDDFQKKAMSGEDLAEYNFGFVNDKGHFLSREDALKYGIDNGLIDPHSGKFGALTTTLMADSSKPGTAIESVGKSPKLWYHGSASGDLRGGSSGLHLGTAEAAKQALEARIGIPAHGKGWTGTEEYGSTLLAGLDTLAKLDPKGNNLTGFNAGGVNYKIPKEDFYAKDLFEKYPESRLKYPDGTEMPLTVKPEVAPYELKGSMSNTPNNPHADFKANGYMRGQLKKGNPKNGYYYTNVGEDSGSISIVVPNGNHVKKYKLIPYEGDPFK